jgi:ERCC4-type nuclease
MFLVAPSEPPELRRLGETSGVPERHGCDVVWTTAPGELAGVQRKTLTDLWVSLRDGRLAREAAAMTSRPGLRVLVIEGRIRWSANGTLATGRAPLRRDQLRGLELSAQRRGIAVVHTDDAADTAEAIVQVRRWHDKARHSSLDLRPAASVPPGTRAWNVHLLQSFPGIGPTIAGNIVDHFGSLPLAWTVTTEALAAVAGVGPKRAASLRDALDDARAQCERAVPSLPA